jgi:hypothetical protein
VLALAACRNSAGGEGMKRSQAFAQRQALWEVQIALLLLSAAESAVPKLCTGKQH